MIAALLILIILILLFGAAAVKGWIGSILIWAGVGVFSIAAALMIIGLVGAENALLVIFGGAIVLCLALHCSGLILARWKAGAVYAQRTRWTEEAERELVQQVVTSAAKREENLAKARDEKARVFGNPVILSKAEKRRRKDEFRNNVRRSRLER